MIKNMKNYHGKLSIQLIISFLLTLVLSALASLRNITSDPVTGKIVLDLNWLKLGMIAVLSFTACHLHAVRQESSPGYLKRRFAGIDKKERLTYLDSLRVTATVLVILAHTIESAAADLPSQTGLFGVMQIFSFVSLSCNLLFIMVSGALLLSAPMEKLSVFYLKRVSKVAVPMILYYLTYQVLLNGSSVLNPGNWSNLIFDLVNGSPSVPHFWFIYVILWLYLLTPLLRRLLPVIEKLSPAMVMAVIVTVCGLGAWLPIICGPAPFGISIICWCGIFMLGYFLSQNSFDIMKPFVYIGALPAFLLAAVMILNHNPLVPFLYNYAPVMLLFSAAIFLLYKSLFRKIPRLPAMINLISQYSFSILLIHWYILFYLVRDRFHLTGLSFHVIGGVPLTLITTLLLSLVFAIIFDNLVTVCVEQVFELLKKRWES